MDDPIRRLVILLKEDKVLGEPTRLLIMILLYMNLKMKFKDLQRILNLTPGNLSSHLKKLKNAGYINIRKSFILDIKPTTIIEITYTGAKKLKEFMRSISDLLHKIPNEQ